MRASAAQSSPPWLPFTFLAPRAPADQVSRPHLLQRLAEGLRPDKRLTVLWGPAGLGKSSLAADWLRGSGRPGLWYNMTPFSLDPALFLSNLLVGLRQVFPTFDPSWAPLLESAGYKAASSAVTGNLHEALAELAPQGFVLVLDWWDAAPTPALRVVIELALDLLPDHAQLVLVSDRPDTLNHLPALSRECVLLGPDELALTPEERRRLGWGEPSDGPSDWLDWRWRLWCQSQGVAPGASLPPPWDRVLAAAAHLPWVEPAIWHSVADPISPWPAAVTWPPILMPLESPHPLWLVHPAARDRFGQTLSETDAREIARRLGVYMTTISPLHAVRAFISAGDMHQAEALAAPAGEHLLGAYHHQALAELLSLFPDAHRAGSPRLSCLQGDLKRVTGALDDAMTHYQTAESQARHRHDASWQGRALAGQAALYGIRGDERFYKLATDAKEVLPAEDLAGRANAYNLLGIYHMQNNELPLAMTYLEESLRLFGLATDRMGQGKVLINLGLCHSKVGKFAKARETYLGAIRCAEDSLKLPIPMVYNNLARILLLEGNLRGAWEAAEQAGHLANQLGSGRDLAHVEWTLGEINAQRGDWPKATLYFESSRHTASEHGDTLAQANALASQAEVAMHQGAWTRAADLLAQARELRGLPLSDPASFNLAEVTARLHLELGEVQLAEDLLNPIHRYTERHGFHYFQTMVEFALARIQQARGDTQAANTLFHQACKRAEEYDFAHLKQLESRSFHERVRIVPQADQALHSVLTVRAFGQVEVRDEHGKPIEALMTSKKTQQLLLHLMLHRRGLTREELSAIFGHQGDSRSSASLMLVSRLRQALQPDLDKHQTSRFILLRDGRYTFNFSLHYSFDAEEFLYLSRHALEPQLKPEERQASLSRALELYRGPFLSSCDDDWCVIERERFRQMAQHGYETLFETFLARQDAKELLRVAEQALKHDVLHENAHRAKLIALARLGKREEALRHFKRTETHLAKKFGLEPGEALKTTFQRLMRGQRFEGERLTSEEFSA
ncbi:MAG: BTAD domain-containing putative transcriptional regulator [Candidatus Sericytochromatia bacterium]|nr:BTAD domain-containing putative transcriptional regulator [Candidatus Sericytochromatia bacterium]